MHQDPDIRLLDVGLERLDALADAAAALIADEGGAPPAPVTLRARLRRRLQEDQRATLFTLDEAIVGHALWTLLTPGVRLEQFRIVPAWRRRGLGRHCLEALVAQRLAGPAPIVVRVLADNGAGIAFWRANGFTTTGDACASLPRCLQILPQPDRPA
ncbi:MAG TPA: GNAT family N-acetyltransferase [Pseudomonadales bacterium]|nr:GNAT family N-acetyltransferase [Pseudomonadales bacterium]